MCTLAQTHTHTQIAVLVPLCTYNMYIIRGRVHKVCPKTAPPAQHSFHASRKDDDFDASLGYKRTQTQHVREEHATPIVYELCVYVCAA